MPVDDAVGEVPAVEGEAEDEEGDGVAAADLHGQLHAFKAGDEFGWEQRGKLEFHNRIRVGNEVLQRRILFNRLNVFQATRFGYTDAVKECQLKYMTRKSIPLCPTCTKMQ